MFSKKLLILISLLVASNVLAADDSCGKTLMGRSLLKRAIDAVFGFEPKPLPPLPHPHLADITFSREGREIWSRMVLDQLEMFITHSGKHVFEPTIIVPRARQAIQKYIAAERPLPALSTNWIRLNTPKVYDDIGRLELALNKQWVERISRSNLPVIGTKNKRLRATTFYGPISDQVVYRRVQHGDTPDTSRIFLPILYPITDHRLTIGIRNTYQARKLLAASKLHQLIYGSNGFSDHSIPGVEPAIVHHTENDTPEIGLFVDQLFDGTLVDVGFDAKAWVNEDGFQRAEAFHFLIGNTVDNRMARIRKTDVEVTSYTGAFGAGLRYYNPVGWRASETPLHESYYMFGEIFNPKLQPEFERGLRALDPERISKVLKHDLTYYELEGLLFRSQMMLD